jgi:hypothetical protein
VPRPACCGGFWERGYLPGALAPPVGLEPASDFEPPPSPAGELSFPSAEAPPPELPPLASEASSLPASPLDEDSLELGVDLVEVVDVEVVCTAAFSALVSLGGVMSGVLLGTASATLPAPPQAPRASEQTSAAQPAAAPATGRLRGARRTGRGWELTRRTLSG